MKTLAIVMIAAAVIYYIALLITLLKSKKPIRSIFISAAVGVTVLIVINLLSRYTGVSLNINGWTIGISASFGIPGVIAMLAAKLFF